MKLPNCDRAVIETAKLTEYLLNLEHRRGSAKARLLLRFGYTPENWQQYDRELEWQYNPIQFTNLTLLE